MPSGAKKKVGAADRPPRSRPSRSSGKKAARPVLEELLELLPQLDDEGLAFLLEQAHVHRYNMEVERLNETADRAASAKEPPSPGKSTAMRLERSTDGLTYHVVAGGQWKMFSSDEMAALVRITRSGDAREEIARRIYAWLDRERPDALDDLGIGKPPSLALAELLRLLLTSFAR